jgi:hypothetical protein
MGIRQSMGRTGGRRVGLVFSCANIPALIRDMTIVRLYEKDTDIPKDLRYILHTEPSLPRSDGRGSSGKPPLKWHDLE